MRMNTDKLTQAFDATYKPGNIVLYKVAEGATIYRGSLVAFDHDGYVVPMCAPGAKAFCGVAEETSGADSGHYSTPGSIRVSKIGSYAYDTDAPFGQDDLGAEVFACGDARVGFQGEIAVGRISGIGETTSSGNSGVRIRIGNHTK
jgi:hypothetical protein